MPTTSRFGSIGFPFPSRGRRTCWSRSAAARFGYLGTAYSAMKKLGVGPGQTFLINGISGMLGLNAAVRARAMGATRILGTGRNVALLNRVKALSPQRIEVFAVGDDKGAAGG